MQPDAEQLNTISRMVEDGDIKPIIDLIYSIEDAVDAYISLKIELKESNYKSSVTFIFRTGYLRFI
jgi:NADPH:quinone reductase-like Zn-dependent oxidoreductase